MTLAPEAQTWMSNSALPKGFEGATLIVERIRLPAHALVPLHTHPFTETITVISGSVGFCLGDNVETSGKTSKAGGFFVHPARDSHIPIVMVADVLLATGCRP